MAEYQCTHCEEPFSREGAGRLRCPRCLRQNGLIPLEELGEAAEGGGRPGKGRLIWGLLILCLVGVCAGAVILFHKRVTDLPAPGQLAQLDGDTLRITLEARGVPAAQATLDPFAAGPGVKKLVSAVKEKEPAARARALAKALGGVVSSFSPLISALPSWSARTPELLLSAAAGATKKPGRGKALSFELAAALVAILREAELPSVLAERFSSAAPIGVGDPSGYLGRYVAVVYRPDQLGKDPLLVLDPLQALALPPWAKEEGKTGMELAGDGLTLLGDASAAAHLLSLRALGQGPKHPERAYVLSLAALAAAAPSATLQLARAQVLASAGGLKDGLAAARKALTLRDDAPRQAGLARLLLASGEAERALTHLRKAIKATPGFWPARLLLASILTSVDREKAEEQLAKGLEIAPEEPGLLLLDGMWHLSRAMPAQAAIRLRKVAAAMDGNLDVKLMLYHAFKGSSQVEEAALLRKKILSMAKNKEEMAARLDMIDKRAAEDEQGIDGVKEGGAVPRLKLPDVSLSP